MSTVTSLDARRRSRLDRVSMHVGPVPAASGDVAADLGAVLTELAGVLGLDGVCLSGAVDMPRHGSAEPPFASRALTAARDGVPVLLIAFATDPDEEALDG